MEKILFIAFYFPPLGGSGVQRSLKFVKYIRSFGYEPVVVASRGIIGNEIDKELLSDIPKNVKVFYFSSYSVLNLKKIIKNKFFQKFIHLLNRLIVPDGLFFWYFFNRKKILKIIRDEKIKIIYSTSSPVSSHLLALYLKRKVSGLKWVADFRDEWADNPMNKHGKFSFSNNPVKNFFDRFLEKKVIDSADKIISVSHGIEKNFSNKYPGYNDKFRTITNGYDGDDFILGKKGKKKNKFIVTYFGSLYGAVHAEFFIEAFSLFLNDQIKSRKLIKVNFIGKIDRADELKKKCKEKKLEDLIFFRNYMSHKKVIAEACNASLLLLFIAEGQHSVLTGKIFEYIKLDVPILAMVPVNGEAAAVVRRTRSGIIAGFKEVNRIKNALDDIFSKWGKNKLFSDYKKNKNYDIIPSYERRFLTGKLGRIFDELKKD